VLDGGDIFRFRLSKVLGHHSVVIMQRFYAHLAPEAWEQDYHRVSFKIPAEAAIYRFERDASGRLTNRGDRRFRRAGGKSAPCIDCRDESATRWDEPSRMGASVRVSTPWQMSSVRYR